MIIGRILLVRTFLLRLGGERNKRSGVEGVIIDFTYLTTIKKKTTL